MKSWLKSSGRIRFLMKPSISLRGLGLEQTQIVLGGRIFEVGEQCLSPVLDQRIELTIQGVERGRRRNSERLRARFEVAVRADR